MGGLRRNSDFFCTGHCNLFMVLLPLTFDLWAMPNGSQRLHQVMLKGPYMLKEIKIGLAIYKANTLLSLLFTHTGFKKCYFN